MLAGLFDFSGRLGRLAYLGRAIALSLVCGAVFALLAAVLIVSLGTLGAGRMAVLAAVVLLLGLLGLAFVVASLALMARRLRDIGLPPVPCCLAIIGFQALDLFVIAPQIAGAPLASQSQHSIPGALINLAVAGVLLFCPGHRGEDADHRRPPSTRSGGLVPAIGGAGRRFPGFGRVGAAS